MLAATLMATAAVLLGISDGWIVDVIDGREVVEILYVDNAGPSGWLRKVEMCPNHMFAAGFALKVEGRQNEGDDTAANIVQIFCKSKSSGGDGYPRGQEGLEEEVTWGDWMPRQYCGSSDGVNDFITSFALKVEAPVGDDDDTAMNNIRVTCRGSGGQQYELEGPGGPWGEWGGWSPTCPAGAAVCGITLRYESYQGLDVDDTALNEVGMYCCNVD